MLIKTTSHHTKNSRSLMNGGGVKIEKRQKNLSNAPYTLSDELNIPKTVSNHTN